MTFLNIPNTKKLHKSAQKQKLKNHVRRPQMKKK